MKLLLYIVLIFTLSDAVEATSVDKVNDTINGTKGINKVPSVSNLSNLVNPLKLSTLQSSRAANSRFNKLMGYIAEYEKRGVSPRKLIDSIYNEFRDVKKYSKKEHVYCPLLEKKRIISSYNKMKNYGGLTSENIELLKKGKSAYVTKGKYIGQLLHVDHIAPKSFFPALENSFANLEPLPAKLNILKSNKITKEGYAVIYGIENELAKYRNPPATHHELRFNKTKGGTMKYVSNHISASTLMNRKPLTFRSKLAHRFRDGVKKVDSLTQMPQVRGTLIVIDVAAEGYLTYRSYTKWGKNEITSTEFGILSIIRGTRLGLGYVAIYDPELISKGGVFISVVALSALERGVEYLSEENYKQRMKVFESCSDDIKYLEIKKVLLN